MEKFNCVAIIVAGGQSLRMGANTPKQYMLLQDKPILAHTIEKFEKCPLVDEIIVVTRKADTDFCWKEIITKYGYQKVSHVAEGGSTRQMSVFRGLEKIARKEGIVLIHDGARPFATTEIIERVYQGANKYGACIPGVQVHDTIKRVTSQMQVQSTVERRGLWAVQTPQGFRLDTLVKAHSTALTDGFTGTDDAMLTERIGVPAYVVDGSDKNIKITTPEDIHYAKYILSTFERTSGDIAEVTN